MAMTATARPILTHGEFDRFHRASRPRTRRLLTTMSSVTSGAMKARL